MEVQIFEKFFNQNFVAIKDIGKVYQKHFNKRWEDLRWGHFLKSSM
jgi:hypothetical protein